MLQNLKARAARASAVVVTGALMAPAAFAQTGVDPGIEAINALKDKGTLYIAAAMGVVVIMAGGWWSIALVKKATRAAK